MTNKCIYCGKANGDLDSNGKIIKINESDIIPFALTRAKLKCKNVCSIEHNSKFSDLFESDIIKELSLIINHLNIITRSKNIFASYKGYYNIKEITFKKTIVSTNPSIDNSVLSSDDGNYKIGPIDILKKFKNYNSKNLLRIYPNTHISFSTKIKLKTFICNNMYRLVAKIAYEFFCKVNGINDKLDIFDDLINFITTGKGNDDNSLVSIISDKTIYDNFNSENSYGDHILLCYKSNTNTINMIYSLFGIAIYRIQIINLNLYSYNGCINFFQKLSISGDNIFIDDTIANKSIASSILSVAFNNLIAEKNLYYSFFFKTTLGDLNKINFTVNTQNLINILSFNIYKLLGLNILDSISLKRFIDDYNLNSSFIINKTSKDYFYWFMLYAILKIGENNITTFNLNSIQSILYFNSNNLIDTSFYKDTVLSTNNYSSYIATGIDLINNWKQ